MPAPLGNLDFIGPLPMEQQSWADAILAEDSAAALFEPVSTVQLRREARVAAAFSDAALLFQSGDDAAWPAVARAIAGARALAWLAAADPGGCWDCLLAGAPCDRHRRLGERRTSTPYDRQPGVDPDWHRFGSEAT